VEEKSDQIETDTFAGAGNCNIHTAVFFKSTGQGSRFAPTFQLSLKNMYAFETQIRVRYGETDQMGYLYYGNYAEYYEVGRVETIRSLGVSYKELEEIHGIWLPVVSLEIKYLRPAYYDDLLTVRTEITSLPDKYINFEVKVFNESKKLINTGAVRLCFYDPATKRTCQAPEFLLEKLRPFFN
jgi:acyl-CoA thioester hydrolase